MKAKNTKSILELKEKELKTLAILSSYIHKKYWDESKCKYLGMKYQFKELNVLKQFRHKVLNTKFHVVKMYPTAIHKSCGTLDRIFIVNYQ